MKPAALKVALATAGVAVLVAGSASAAEPAHPALAELSGCAAVAETAAKAACFEAAAAALDRAVRAGEIVIVQRQEAQAAQRNAFGLNLPSLSILDRASGSTPLESVTGEVVRARRDESGRWVVELKDGAVWRQTDDIPLSPPPRPGSRVEIRRAALGSFFMKIDAHRGVRARRSE